MAFCRAASVGSKNSSTAPQFRQTMWSCGRPSLSSYTTRSLSNLASFRIPTSVNCCAPRYTGASPTPLLLGKARVMAHDLQELHTWHCSAHVHPVQFGQDFLLRSHISRMISSHLR